jgi:5-methylthioadenosine/S-adenosylhomocysteine deaminase
MGHDAKRVKAIRASYVLAPDGDTQTVLRDRVIVIEEDRIRDVCDRYDGPADLWINAEGKLVSPGFINAHVHSGAAVYVRGLVEDQDLLEGSAFYHYVVPLITVGAANFSVEEFSAIVEWDMLEMVKKGSTTILEENFDHYEAVVDIVRRLGNRAYVSATYPSGHTNIGYIKDGKLHYDAPKEGAAAGGLRRNIELHDKYSGSADDRIRVRLSPTGPDTCPPEVLRATREAADRLGCGISIHAAHHNTEISTCRKRFRATPIQHLANTGILGRDAIITHVTYTDEEDRRLLADSGSTVAHCSYRKAREAVIGPYWEYLSRGINVALGTDSYSSDITETIKMAAILGKIRMERVGVPTAAAVLNSATLGGARGLGRSDLGRIEPGAKADVVIIDLNQPHNCPVLDPIKNFVYYSFGTDVETVIVDGQVLVENRKALTTNEEELRQRVIAASTRIWSIAQREQVIPGVKLTFP